MSESLREAARRVPHVQETAVVGDTAILRGRSAWLLARILAKHVPGGLGSLLVRIGASPEDRDAALRAYAALEHVGHEWRQQLASSSDGNPEAERADADLGSEQWIATKDTALLLDRSPRRVRQLAMAGTRHGGLPARRVGGRWLFPRAAVLAYRERRDETVARVAA